MNYNDNKMKLFWVLMVLILILSLFIVRDSVVIGQTPAPTNNRPNLTGTVYYSDGKIHAPSNWSITLYNGSWLTRNTDINGRYSFQNLSPDTYEMSIHDATDHLTYDNKSCIIPNIPYPITFDPVTS
jgi:hypothetical protein